MLQPQPGANFSFGAIPSQLDYRDQLAAAGVLPQSYPTLPTTYHTDLGPVLMQSKEPACVSHSVTYLIKLYFFGKTGKWIDFSPRFLDILSAEPDIPLDGGRRPRTVLKVAATQGICTTATLANDTSLPIAQYRDVNAISDAARQEAEQYKIPGYVSIAIDKMATRFAIYTYGAVSTLFTVGPELYTAPDGTVTWADSAIDPLRPPSSQILGGHQLSPNGWVDDTYNTLRNEWSAAWANNGEARYSFPAWYPFTHEQWAIAEVPTDVAAFLHNLPAASDFHYQWNQTLVYGTTSDDVRMAQVAFLILGYMQPFPPDEWGIFGPKTADANLAFQRAHGITQTAPHYIGPLTRAALNRQFAV